MDAIIIYPETLKDLKTIKTIAKVLNYKFETKHNYYNQKFVAKIERAKKIMLMEIT